MRKRSLLLLVLAVGLAMVVAVPWAAAQEEEPAEPTGFQNVRLWLYPEYDDPRLLVMLEGNIVGAEPPATVRFLVPSTAEMYSAGSMDLLGNYTGGPPERQAAELLGWDEIKYQVTTGTFRVEYYDPIILGTPEKTISYEFHTLYPISDLTVYVQEPRGSSGFSVVPQAGRQIVDQEGFPTHVFSRRGVKAGDVLQFDIAYTRTATKPSLMMGQGSLNPVAIAVAAAAVVVIGGGAYWLYRGRSGESRQARRRRQRAAAARAGAARAGQVSRRGPAEVRRTGGAPGRQSGGGGQRDRFCRQCGEPITPSARFCPGCGKRLQ